MELIEVDKLFDYFVVKEGVDYVRGGIHSFSYEGNLEEVSKLLAKKTDVDELDLSSSHTPLHYSCLSGSLNVAVELTQRGALVEQTKPKAKQQYPTSFFVAAGGNEKILNFLLKRGAVLERVCGPLSLLHVVIHFGHLGFADLVLQKGLSPDIGEEILSPLQLASKEGNLKAVHLLLDYGAKVNPKLGQPTPLHYAATSGASGVVDELISAGCPVDSLAPVGTPLCCACRVGQFEMAKILIQKGAKVKINFDKTFGTPLHLSATFGSSSLISLLLSYNADIEAVTCSLKTVLHCAAEGGHLELVKMLIEKGLRANSTTITGRTPLHEASERGHFTVVRYLAENAGADVMLKESSGKTARQIAAGEQGKDIGKYLQALETIKGGGKTVTSISLANLGLEAIPLQLMSLKRLQTIDLRNNKIETIPHAITSLSDLTTLKLTGNPLKLMPKQAVDEKGKASVVLSFLKNLEDVDYVWKRVKLMIVGKEAVGKTSFFRALKGSEKNIKLDQKGDTVSTEGIDISELNIGDVDFSAWDFGGQEVFYPTHTFFLTKKAVYLVLFNILDDDLAAIEYWIRLIKATTDQAPPLLLVATHSDMISSQETLEQRLGVVKERFRNHRNIRCVLAVSSRTKDGLEDFSDKLTKTVQESGMIHRKVPGSYLLLERRIDFLRKKCPTLSWIEFLEIAQAHGISSEAGAKKACRFFHDNGVLLHFDDTHSELSNLVILDPQWLANVMSRLVSFRTENKIRDGVLTFAKLCGIWHEFSDDMRLKMLLLLERFQIAYRMRPPAFRPDMGSLKANDFSTSNTTKGGAEEEEKQAILKRSESYDIIVPSLLPGEPPSKKILDSHWPKSASCRTGTDEYRRIYQFDFLPLGLFGRIIVRMMHIGVAYPIKWREGIVLRSTSHQEGSFITFQPKVYQLHIHHRVYRRRGKNPSHSLFTQIIFAIDSLLEGYYPGLSQTLQRLIPCRHCYNLKETGKYERETLFTFEECAGAIQRENPFVVCRVGGEMGGVRLNVAFLAPDIALSGLKQVTNVEIVGKIGEGGFGMVYKGKMGEKLVAIKELKKKEKDGKREEGEGVRALEQFQEFQRECFIMSKLDHPNLVKLHGVWLCPFVRMVMEYVPCGDLMGLLERQWEGKAMREFILECGELEVVVEEGGTVYVEVEEVERAEEGGMVMIQIAEQRGKGPLDAIKLKEKRPLRDEEIPDELRLKIIYDIAKGMKYLQSMVPPIIHRDLRSPNIFLVSTDPTAKVNAKVADFGLSRLVETKIGGFLGTWQWLAPEVIDTDTSDYDERSDIYSFGIVSYEVLSRRLPFVDDYHERFLRGGYFNKWGCVDAIINDHLRPILPTTTDPELQRIIQQCWSSDPSVRPSFKMIVSALEGLMREKGMGEFVEDTEAIDTKNKETRADSNSLKAINTRYSPSLRIHLGKSNERLKPFCFCFSKGHMIVGASHSTIQVWTLRGTLVKTLKLPLPEKPIEVRSVYEVNGTLLVMGDNGVWYVYSVEGWEFLCQMETPHRSNVRCSVLVRNVGGKDTSSKEGIFLVSADVTGLVSIREVDVKEEGEISVSQPLDLVNVGVPIVYLSSVSVENEPKIAAGGVHGDLYLFNLFPFELLGNVVGAHGGSRVTGIIEVPLTGEIWTGGNNGGLNIWKILPMPKDIQEPSSPSQSPSPMPSSVSLPPTPEGDIIQQELFSLERPLRKVESMMWVLVETISSNQGRIKGFCIAKNGLVCSSSFGSSVRFWDPLSRVCIQELKGHEDSVGCLFCSSEDDFSLWTGSYDLSVCVWTPNNTGGGESRNHTHELFQQLHPNTLLGGEAEGGKADIVKEDASLEERIRIIDQNINGLKEMNRSHVMDMKKATKLCDIILKDLKEAMARATEEPVIMRNLEDRITVILIEKKQLHSKTAPNSPAGQEKGSKPIEKTPLSDAMAKCKACLTQFYENLRLTLGSYEDLLQKETSAKMCSSIFRNMADMVWATTKLREELKISAKKVSSQKGAGVAKATEMARCFKKFFQVFIAHLDTFVHNHQTAMVALQLCFYRPSLATLLVQKRAAVGRSLEELLDSPHSFMRHTPFLLGGIVEHLPVDSEPSVLFQSLVWDVRTKLWELNQTRVSQEIGLSLRFVFSPKELDFENTEKLLMSGECLLKHSSVVDSKGEESIIVSQQRTLLFYIFENRLVLVSQTCGREKEFKRRVSFLPSPSILKLEDVPEGDNLLGLLFPARTSTKNEAIAEDMWEKWLLQLPSNLVQGHLKRALCDIMHRNMLLNPRKDPRSRSMSVPHVKKAPYCKYLDTFPLALIDSEETPFTDQVVRLLPLFEDLYSNNINIFENIINKEPAQKKKKVKRASSSRLSSSLIRSINVSKSSLRGGTKMLSSGGDDKTSEDDERKLNDYLLRKIATPITNTTQQTPPSPNSFVGMKPQRGSPRWMLGQARVKNSVDEPTNNTN